MANNAPTSFRPHEPIETGIARIIGELVDNALAHATHPTGDPDENIHAIRTSIKQLRACLLLLRPTVAERSYQRENARLRKAAQRLAPSRDLTVARKTLLALAKKAGGKRDRE